MSRLSLFLFILFIFSTRSAALPSTRLSTCSQARQLSIPKSKGIAIGEKPLTTYLSSNARFPQLDAGLYMGALAQYLTQEISIQEMARPWSENEYLEVENATNKLHKVCNVPYRTRGHPEFDGKHEVKRDFLERQHSLVMEGTVSKLVKLAAVLDKNRLYVRPREVITSETMQRIENALLESPALERFQDLGEAVLIAFGDPTIEAPRQAWLNYLRAGKFDRESKDFQSTRSDLVKKIRIALLKSLRKKFSSQEAEAILNICVPAV